MHSSTSSSSSSSSAGSKLAPEPVFERPLPATRFRTAGIVALVLAVTALGVWEFYWRGQGVYPSYRNSEGLWAMQRRRIDNGEGHKTVLIGSSRTLSNIALHVWQRLDGERPIQLALEGTSPMQPLEDLANDPDFKGRLIVGVSPGLFFSGFQYRKEVLDYYPKETPAQRFSQWLSMTFIEPYVAFYDPDLALFPILKRQPWPLRPGVRYERDVRKLFVSEADRNMRMWERLEQDASYRELAQKIWRDGFPPLTDGFKKMMLESRVKQIDRAVAAVAKLKQRGIEVIFILHPVDGEFYDFEITKTNPRAETWDVLLARTGARGIHFEDFPELQGMWLPEWSHLCAADQLRFTEAVYRIIKEGRDVQRAEKGN
jgi:hypothetical protein